jgi:hypothetical protein
MFVGSCAHSQHSLHACCRCICSEFVQPQLQACDHETTVKLSAWGLEYCLVHMTCLGAMVQPHAPILPACSVSRQGKPTQRPLVFHHT